LAPTKWPSGPRKKQRNIDTPFFPLSRGSAGSDAARAKTRSGGLLLDLLLLADLDLTRAHSLGDLADEIDGQQPIHEIGLRHLDVVRQVEPALEGAAGDAVVEIERLLAGVLAA